MISRSLILGGVLLLGPVSLGAQAGNANVLLGLRFDGGRRFPSVGGELQLGPRPWFVKVSTEFHASFTPASGPDTEEGLGLTWIAERASHAIPYLGVGGALTQRRYSEFTTTKPAAYVHGGLLMRRGTNGNFGIDFRFLTGAKRPRVNGTLEPIRYFQISALLGFGW